MNRDTAENGGSGEGVPCRTPSTRGMVLGIGSASESAERVAAFMGRTVTTAGRLSEAWSALAAVTDHSSALVLLPRRRLTFEVANALIEASCRLDRPIGVLPLDDRNEQRVLARLCGPPRSSEYSHRIAFYCDFFDRPPGPATPATPVFGSLTSGPFIKRLKEGTEAVVLHVHGNGADFRVGTDVLCVQVGATRPAPGKRGERCLPCQAGGPCRLEHKTSFTAFHGASVVRSRLVVLLSCSAFHPSDGLLDPCFLFIDALLRGDHVDGVVASTMINFCTPELGLAAMASLDAGATLGEVAKRINGLSRYGPPSYLCLGDPELRLNGAATVAPATLAPIRRGTAPVVTTEPAPHVQTVSHLFAADLLTISGERQYDELRDRLRTAAHALPNQATSDGSLDRELAGALAAIAVRYPDGVASVWRPICEELSVAPAAACPRCGQPTIHEYFRSRLYRPCQRAVWRCQRHGVVGDWDTSAEYRPLKITSAGNLVVRVDRARAAGFVVVALARTDGTSELREVPDHPGTSAFEVPPGGRSGLLQMHGGRFCWLSMAPSSTETTEGST